MKIENYSSPKVGEFLWYHFLLFLPILPFLALPLLTGYKNVTREKKLLP